MQSNVQPEGRGPRSIEEIERPQFTLWESRAQTAGSALLGALVLLAALGLFGNGVLSETSADGEGFSVDYPRFMRRESIETITVRIASTAAEGGTLPLRIDSAYLETLRLREISPEPSSVTIDGEAHVYEFDFQGGAAATIVIRFSPERPGLLSGRFALEQGPAADIRHLVYP